MLLEMLKLGSGVIGEGGSVVSTRLYLGGATRMYSKLVAFHELCTYGSPKFCMAFRSHEAYDY